MILNVYMLFPPLTVKMAPTTYRQVLFSLKLTSTASKNIISHTDLERFADRAFGANAVNKLPNSMKAANSLHYIALGLGISKQEATDRLLI